MDIYMITEKALNSIIKPYKQRLMFQGMIFTITSCYCWYVINKLTKENEELRSRLED